MATVELSDIESVSRSALDTDRLHMLENGHDPFNAVLNSASDPIALDGSRKPYRIVDGRHRVYLARQKGYSSVQARFV